MSKIPRRSMAAIVPADAAGQGPAAASRRGEAPALTRSGPAGGCSAKGSAGEADRAGAPAWHIAALEAERCVLSDDDSGAVRPRALATALLARIAATDMGKACPDRAVFALFVQALTLWAGRLEPHERDRVRGVTLVAIAAVCALVREDHRRAEARAALSPLERALAPGDR